MTHEELERERKELLEEITAAFQDVSRAGGISWSEAEVIDNYGTEEEQIAARRQDTDNHWTELLEPNQGWDPSWSSRFSFLDAIGFRYYLPATMIRCIYAGHDNGICFHLTVDAPCNGSRVFTVRRLSLLDSRQSLLVARFIVYMTKLAMSRGEHWHTRIASAQPWLDAYTSYWSLLPGAPQLSLGKT